MKTRFIPPSIILLLLCNGLNGQLCSQSSPKYARFAQNNAAIGSIAWSDPENSKADDNVYSKAGVFLGILASANSNYLILKDFDFHIPAGAEICGIEVTRIGSVDGLLVGSSVKDNDVRIIKNNIITGSQHATSSNWPASDGSATWGGNLDLWGEDWEAEDINSPNFGIAISVKLSAGLASLFLTAKIEAVTITVYYNVVLPLEAPKLVANVVDDRVKLEWTVDEGRSDYYVVQRKANNTNKWYSLDTIVLSRLTNIRNSYQSYDPAPLPVNEYRVLNVLVDGRVIPSQVVRVTLNLHFPGITVYPNPGNGIFYLKSNGITTINVFRSDGSIVPFKKSRHGNEWKLELNEPSGIYFVKAGTDGGILVKQVMLVK